MDRRYAIDGANRQDGRCLLTSPDLPGFRLLLAQAEDTHAYDAPIVDALHVFLPLFLAASGTPAAAPQKIDLRHGLAQGHLFQITATCTDA